MSEEPLANKSRPPPALPDAEYDIIYATVSETAQGRRFLEEYTRRRRPAETEASLAAIERMQAVIRAGGTSERLQILLEMADMAQAIVQLRTEILAMRPPGPGQLEATEELDSIVLTTESATSRILAAAEQVQEIAWTMRESGSIEALCDELDAQATEIYTACSFQDLTGQRTRKVIHVLRYLEERINTLVAAQDQAPPAADKAPDVLMQAGVDAVMQPEVHHTQEDRQDATLEEISRVMLAIEPMIGLPQITVAKPAEIMDEVRPELSVAEAVMAEDVAARKLAEWAVDPAALAKPTEGNAPLADWVVEDPEGPQPDSEPAWMILRRMEAELDEQREPSDKADPPTAASPPSPAIPTPPAVAESAVPAPSPPTEPGLFVAEAMSQLAQELRPVSLLPPPELTFRTKLPAADPLADLATAMATSAMKLPQLDDDALSPETTAAIKNAQPEPSRLMQRAAAAVGEARAFTAQMQQKPAEADPDDFLFAPEESKGLETPLQQSGEAEPAPLVTDWKAGTFPNPALVTPEKLPAAEAEAEQQKSSSPPHDPLAPLRAMSDAQKIALFS